VAELGHHVVGVDSSAAMLAHLRLARGVRSRIETLDLAERFDAVVLAGHLVNTYDPAQRRAFLATARLHLRPGGFLILQRYPADYRPSPGLSWTAGPVELELRDIVQHEDGVFSATLIHRYATMTAEQDFSAGILTDDTLREVLGSAGFDLVSHLTADARWVLATAKA
jgi:cyclopropane fatty-acyl-phospholipid synthase-like methyltransferase